ncbi:alpha-ketoglutarate-dependent dioxygenase AlkB family protein [Zwartia vadi]|uniref:alpha-ketoglutarate-dependent dioxygenase AlkB family protein n=1 Tax=Zwartia vadi TaxID=3058168 RepID=UPI0025B3F023|nr:alpha-ketoglutarate-dependent dioxygenase AlkB [Zwartia vadi]MDN3986973.1 alpha-ketoglutarate-dependent dioxygenase AlkB [Zwartia vadi]
MQTNLFETCRSGSAIHVLSRDGRVDYYPAIFDPDTCAALVNALTHSLDWQVDQIYMFGKLITTKRKVAWVADEGCSYTYSGVKKTPQAWTPELIDIKNQLEEISKWKFNSCLLNLYHDGSEGMGWHSDDEPELERAAPIASLSLGGERKFSFKHKADRESVSLPLENGSVLIMHAPTQEHWHHSLLKTKRPVAPRINLTFRSTQ